MIVFLEMADLGGKDINLLAWKKVIDSGGKGFFWGGGWSCLLLLFCLFWGFFFSKGLIFFTFVHWLIDVCFMLIWIIVCEGALFSYFQCIVEF